MIIFLGQGFQTHVYSFEAFLFKFLWFISNEVVTVWALNFA